MVQCELVKVSVTADDFSSVSFVVPAYTIDAPAMQSRVEMLLREYLANSKRENESMSLGDFALYLLTEASEDPREQA